MLHDVQYKHTYLLAYIIWFNLICSIQAQFMGVFV